MTSPTSSAPHPSSLRARQHRCTPRVMTHPAVVGTIVCCATCGRMPRERLLVTAAEATRGLPKAG